MGVDVTRPIRRVQRASRAAALPQAALAQKRISPNAIMGIGMWTLLWAGYNAAPDLLFDPRLMTTAGAFIQGIRAYFPILGGWVALIVIMTRINRLAPWISGPLGWLFFYSIVGLASSLFVSSNASYATFFGCTYLSIVLMLVAIVMVPNPLPDLRHVMTFTWLVSVFITFGILGVIPGLGRGALTGYQGEIREGNYQASGEILGMASRNTGFARYAAISGIVALSRLWEGKRSVRFIWFVVFLASFYSLVIANGRTEVLAFVASAFLVMWVQRARRTVFVAAGVAATCLLGVMGFFSHAFLYLTRTGKVDLSITGRTRVWVEGWDLFLRSPWWGFGFQADRVYLSGQHIHDAFLHVLIQTGVLGGGAAILALTVVWWVTAKHFVFRQPRDKSLIPPDIPGVLLFITISSISESTFAYYSAAWMLSAPIFPYVLALDRMLRKSGAGVLPKKFPRAWGPKRSLRDVDSEEPAEGIALTNPEEIPPE